jgi:hypothetical protein
MGFIARRVLVLRCGSAGAVWYPYAGISLRMDTTPPHRNTNTRRAVKPMK